MGREKHMSRQIFGTTGPISSGTPLPRMNYTTKIILIPLFRYFVLPVLKTTVFGFSPKNRERQRYNICIYTFWYFVYGKLFSLLQEDKETLFFFFFIFFFFFFFFFNNFFFNFFFFYLNFCRM